MFGSDLRFALRVLARRKTSSLLVVSMLALGIASGVAVSIGVARLLSDLLFGVSPHDATILGASVLVLLATAMLANRLPARRASRVDPMSSLPTD